MIVLLVLLVLQNFALYGMISKVYSILMQIITAAKERGEDECR